MRIKWLGEIGNSEINFPFDGIDFSYKVIIIQKFLVNVVRSQ